MGSLISKEAKPALKVVRKYPSKFKPNTRVPPPPSSPAAPAAAPAPSPPIRMIPQTARPKNKPSEKDTRDPAFASRLNRIGAVQPNPHYSPTSTSKFDPQRRRDSSKSSPPDRVDVAPPPPPPPPSSEASPGSRYYNPVLRVLGARLRIAEQAEEEMRRAGKKIFEGKKYVDASTIQLALIMQAKGEPNDRIEELLGIKKGRLNVLGKGIVSPG